MDDISNTTFFIMLVILIIISIMFILKHHYHWNFKVSIKRKEESDSEDESDEESDEEIEDEEIDAENKNNKNIDTDDVKPFELEHFTPNTETDKKDIDLSKYIEEEVNKKVAEKMEELKLKRNNDEEMKQEPYEKYDVMLNEPIGRLKQSTLMIDQIVNKNLERYYRYVKPVAIEDKHKDAYNANTFCIKCDSKDQEYSNYFYGNPLDYQNDDLANNDDNGIKAYNV